MALLLLDGVSKRFKRGGRHGREQVGLLGVRLQVDAGELVAVWGRRRSGRTTLLQVAAGVERPSEGVVRFDGVDLARRPMLGREGGLGYVNAYFAPVIGESVLEQVSAPLLGGGGMSVLDAQSLAYEALRRVKADGCARLDVDALDHDELIRVAIARALVTAPRMLVVDEPTQALPPARGRDGALGMLRSLAARDRIAVLMTVAEAADMAGADRALTIDRGELRGVTQPATAQVIELCRPRSESSA